MQDVAGAALVPGDLVCDSRGKMYRVRPTEMSFERLRLAKVVQVHNRRGVMVDADAVETCRIYMTLRLGAGLVWTEKIAREAWAVAAEARAEGGAAAVRRRKEHVKNTMSKFGAFRS